MAIQLRASSSLSSASSTGSCRHDVFLSFRGEDTRYNFTDHLHRNLVQRGIKTFIDDELPRGEEISEALLRAIEGSKLSLIVFSKNYASSKWCLEELVHILECKRSKNQMVRAIFYKVDPSDVRHQRGTFDEALAEHEHRFQDDRTNKVSRWRKALSEAANLSGWTFSGGSESNFIYRIIEEISAKLIKQTPLNVAKSPVGIESRVQDMLKLLAVGGGDIMVGIWGTGGIGKTTIAKAVYNLIANEFEDSCFLANVRERSVSHEGLVNLQNSLLFEIFGGELKVINADQGITLLSERLRYKRILLVLDDVDQLDQLERLAGGPDWFHSGSRVIITTRDKHLLIVHQVNKSKIYKARRLDHVEARELFCANALMTDRDLDNDEKLAVNTVVKYAEGLPLALKVLGKHLCDRPIHQWQALLDRHRRSPLQGIQKILKISYDSLEEPEKEIFLDIACFFKYKNKNDLIAILEGCGYSNPMFSIDVLEEKALLNVEHAYIFMHDLLEEMGKKIVHEESPKEPGRRSRLWYHSDVLQVLTENTGSETIEGIMVNMPTADVIRLSPKCFKKMRKLKVFINVNGRFCGRVDYLPDQLRILDWPDCPLQSLPSKFNMKNLVQLIMSGSPIPCLGEGCKRMRNLKSLNLKKSEFLEQIPDLSASPNLEFLDLSFCTSLKKIHPSVGYLEKLVELDLEECSKLEMLPGEVNWRSLRHINLNSCRRLESFPEIVGEMKYMTSLALSRTGIKALPSSIGYLINLEELSLHSCGNLTDLPCSIYELQNLKDVRLSWCQKLVTFPNKVDSECSKVKRKHLECSDNRDSLSKKLRRSEGSSLEPKPDTEFNLALPWLHQFRVSGCNLSNINHLGLDCTSIVFLPECIKKFVNLRELNLSGCKRLVEIPELPPGIEWLCAKDCVSLERFSKLSNILERKESQKMIEEMDLTNCRRLSENLAQMANKEDDEVDADLFSRLLSSQQFKFIITFPVPRSEVPKWFSCQMDSKGHQRFEFCIETLANFKWENTGLALCVAVDKKLQDTSADTSLPFYFDVYIHINKEEVSPIETQSVGSAESDHVWLQYVPFLEMWEADMRPLPPFKCRVIINQWKNSGACLKSCGIHLVMPPNEDVCMKLIHAENLTDVEDSFYYEDGWDNYRPEQRTYVIFDVQTKSCSYYNAA